MVKSVSHLPAKIDVVKFDDMNNFGMWRCEVMMLIEHTYCIFVIPAINLS